jgi:hypothetical protein
MPTNIEEMTKIVEDSKIIVPKPEKVAKMAVGRCIWLTVANDEVFSKENSSPVKLEDAIKF